MRDLVGAYASGLRGGNSQKIYKTVAGDFLPRLTAGPPVTGGHRTDCASEVASPCPVFRFHALRRWYCGSTRMLFNVGSHDNCVCVANACGQCVCVCVCVCVCCSAGVEEPLDDWRQLEVSTDICSLLVFTTNDGEMVDQRGIDPGISRILALSSTNCATAAWLTLWFDNS